jgi:tetratricopeptide (TPR) repeat protein
LQTADGNAYEVMRTLALLDQAKVKGGEVVGNTLAAVMTRTELVYLSDTQRFIDEMQKAIALDAGNPLPYAYRALAYQRLQKYDEARRDTETVSRLGPPGWTIPLYLQAADVFLAQQDYPRSVKVYASIVEAHPNDWFAVTARGFSYYRLGQYDLARADFNNAIASGPNANVPYLAAMLLAFREGRIGDAQKFAGTILTRFPDPLLASRIISAAFGDPAESGLYIGPLFSAGANTVLGQYDSVLKDIDLALKTADKMPDLYLLRGVAYCGLNKYADAEKAYSRALELDPKYAVVYALRAEARIKQNNMPGALLDVAQAKNAKLGAEFDALVDAGLKGEVGCQNFFSPKKAS